MNKERLEEIKKRCEAATEAPWEIDGPYIFHVYPVCCNHPDQELDGSPVCCGSPEPAIEKVADCRLEDADFIANARQDIPDLIAALEAAQERIAKLQAVAEAARNIQKWKDADYAGSSGVIVSAIQFLRLKDALAALEF